MTESSVPYGSTAAITPEVAFLNTYIGAISRLQECWMADVPKGEALRSNSFILQIHFLIALVPDEDRRDQIRKEIAVVEDQFKKEGRTFPTEKACMVAVSRLVEYIVSAFDLVHSDILGPATARQHRDAVLEIPAMPLPAQVSRGVSDEN